MTHFFGVNAPTYRTWFLKHRSLGVRVRVRVTRLSLRVRVTRLSLRARVMRVSLRVRVRVGVGIRVRVMARVRIGFRVGIIVKVRRGGISALRDASVAYT